MNAVLIPCLAFSSATLGLVGFDLDYYTAVESELGLFEIHDQDALPSSGFPPVNLAETPFFSQA